MHSHEILHQDSRRFIGRHRSLNNRQGHWTTCGHFIPCGKQASGADFEFASMCWLYSVISTSSWFELQSTRINGWVGRAEPHRCRGSRPLVRHHIWSWNLSGGMTVTGMLSFFQAKRLIETHPLASPDNDKCFGSLASAKRYNMIYYHRSLFRHISYSRAWTTRTTVYKL